MAMLYWIRNPGLPLKVGPKYPFVTKYQKRKSGKIRKQACFEFKCHFPSFVLEKFVQTPP